MSCMMVEVHALGLRIWARNRHILMMLLGRLLAGQHLVERWQHYKPVEEGGSREAVVREEMGVGCCLDLEVGDRT